MKKFILALSCLLILSWSVYVLADAPNLTGYANAAAVKAVLDKVAGLFSGTPEANDVAVFTDADTVQGLSYTEFIAAIESALASAKFVRSDENETITGSWSFGPLTLADATDVPDAVGQVRYVNNALSFTDGAVGWYDDDEARYFIDTAMVDDTAGGTDALTNRPPSSNALYDVAQAKLSISDIDDTPVDSETAAPISSNWAHDHAAATATHGVSGAIVGTTDAQDLSNKTIILDDNDSLEIMADADGMDDDEFNGITITGRNAGEALTQWNCVRLANDADPWHQADANAAGEFPAIGLVVAATDDGSEAKVLIRGVVRNEGWTGLTPGGAVYLSATAGGITQTAPSTAGDCVQIVGFALSDSEILFDFSRPYQEVE